MKTLFKFLAGAAPSVGRAGAAQAAIVGLPSDYVIFAQSKPTIRQVQMSDLNYTTRDQLEAIKVRKTWMREMGVPPDEIEEFCTGGPFSLIEEENELRTVRDNKKNILSNHQLAQFAAKNPPPAGWLD